MEWTPVYTRERTQGGQLHTDRQAPSLALPRAQWRDGQAWGGDAARVCRPHGRGGARDGRVSLCLRDATAPAAHRCADAAVGRGARVTCCSCCVRMLVQRAPGGRVALSSFDLALGRVLRLLLALHCT